MFRTTASAPYIPTIQQSLHPSPVKKQYPGSGEEKEGVGDNETDGENVGRAALHHSPDDQQRDDVPRQPHRKTKVAEVDEKRKPVGPEAKDPSCHFHDCLL